ncbi:4'-phosphopantetheinyl transferase superfamily protein [Streptomyces sp. 5-8]|uniref:4'-phosphopantetheinyl transferase superfamily protein n=1 Tax=Streptomyces musisoli TaxID=2802280 RepID=A0ABS1NT64_9ACTN|nr:4'-phosphopantetheinyl transferase superfamily protein [Streptomyces musisoli]MBL1103057.1 4'-phosphopantetheinyl transferase superfamily protein [Streptomyces musisoli]
MGEPNPAGSGHVAVWVAVGAAPEGEPLDLDQRARRYRRARATARRVGRQLVTAYTSCPPDRQAWERDDRGRPLLVDPGGLHVSLSHAEAVVAAALSWDAPVGVDVERLRPLADRGALARTALSETERQAVDALPEPLRDAQLLRFWTRKEAVAKALGTGLATNLRGIVTTAHGAVVSLPDECGDVSEWSLTDVPVREDVIACVTVRAPGVRVLPRTLALPADEG